MGKTRQDFTPEYKDEAVKLVVNIGRTMATVDLELGINEATLGRSVNAFKVRTGQGPGKVVRCGVSGDRTVVKVWWADTAPLGTLAV